MTVGFGLAVRSWGGLSSALAECVTTTELGDELGAVFGGVDGEGGGDGEEGRGECADG